MFTVAITALVTREHKAVILRTFGQGGRGGDESTIPQSVIKKGTGVQ